MTPSLLPMSSPPVVAVQPPRLLYQVAQAARQRGASQPTTAQLVSFVRAFVLFHGKCHPRELGLPAVTRFLEHSVRTEKQPLPALDKSVADGSLVYHYHSSGHTVLPADWKIFFDFADRHYKAAMK